MTARRSVSREQARKVLGWRTAYGWDVATIAEHGPSGAVWRVVVAGRPSELVIDSRGDCVCVPLAPESRSA